MLNTLLNGGRANHLNIENLKNIYVFHYSTTIHVSTPTVKLISLKIWPKMYFWVQIPKTGDRAPHPRNLEISKNFHFIICNTLRF